VRRAAAQGTIITNIEGGIEKGEETVIALPNRRCGKVTPGGLYAVSRMSAFGTLLPFTAVAAPLPAEVANARKPEIVDTARTLCGLAGLVHLDPHVDIGRFARLPKIGVADYWGQSQGYKSVWDCVEETQRLGVCRRVANVPSVPLPTPVLMLHAEAVMDVSGQRARDWLTEQFGWTAEQEPAWASSVYSDRFGMVDVEDQPWREAHSLGREGDDDFMWHPHVKLWEIMPQLRKRRLFSKFRGECGVRFEEGVFGLSWITDVAYVLKRGEKEVPNHLAARGVIAAVAQDDSRAREVA